MSEKSTEIKKLKIVRSFPDDLQSHFTNHFVIQHRPDHFILSFFQIWSPIILDDDDVNQLMEESQLEAKCVSRLILTPTEIESLSAALQENIQNYHQKNSEGIFNLLQDKDNEN